MEPPEPSELLAGRYLLGERLGEGGAATVFRARDVRLGVDCAVKVLTPHRSSLRASLRRRLQAEARVMARLAHPNILPVTDVGEGDGIDFVVMGLAEGGSLADRLKSEGPLAPEEAVEVGLQVLSALEAAHGEGVVHRDVKPQNLLVTRDGRVQLADFGIALVTGPDADRRTRTGVAMGSMAFMAPEQRLDASRVDASADLYATAATLYTLLTNRSHMDLFIEDGGSPRWSRIPRPLLPVIFKATRHSPLDRYASAADMARALRRTADSLETGPLAVPDAGEHIPSATHPSWLSQPGPDGKGTASLAPTTVGVVSEPTSQATEAAGATRVPPWVGLGVGGVVAAAVIVAAVAVPGDPGEPVPGEDAVDAVVVELPEESVVDTGPPAGAGEPPAPEPGAVQPELGGPAEVRPKQVESARHVPAPQTTGGPPESAPRVDRDNHADVAAQNSGPPPQKLQAGVAAPGGQWWLNAGGVSKYLRVVVDGQAARGTIESRLGAGRVRVAVQGRWDPASRTFDLQEDAPADGTPSARYTVTLDAGLSRVESGSLTVAGRGFQTVTGKRQPPSEW